MTRTRFSARTVPLHAGIRPLDTRSKNTRGVTGLAPGSASLSPVACPTCPRGGIRLDPASAVVPVFPWQDDGSPRALVFLDWIFNVPGYPAQLAWSTPLVVAVWPGLIPVTHETQGLHNP